MKNNVVSEIILLVMVFATLVFSASCQAQPPIRFAVIGDYGWEGKPAEDVAALVSRWNPDFVITTGDNNYDFGADSTIDPNIGQYYHSFIFPYTGKYGKGDTVNRFFPSLGNHDWRDTGAAAYLKYFTLPGNERYYDFVKGPVHFFAIDSDEKEPDGSTETSVQAQWLKKKLSESTFPWKVVYFHHPPYSSGAHGNSPRMAWPFEKWGASVVFSGHDHTYERLIVGSIPFFISGIGGRSYYDMKQIHEGSKLRFTGEYGAMDVTADAERMTFRFVTRKDSVVDTYTLTRTKK